VASAARALRVKRPTLDPMGGTVKYCAGCGAQVEDATAYCAACGHSVDPGEGVMAAEQTAPHSVEVPRVLDGARRRRLRIATIVAAILSVAILAAFHIFTVQRLPELDSAYRAMGGTLPAMTEYALGLLGGAGWTYLLLGAAALFGVLYLLARRYVISLVLAAPFTYLLVVAALQVMLWLPRFETVTLVH